MEQQKSMTLVSFFTFSWLLLLSTTVAVLVLMNIRMQSKVVAMEMQLHTIKTAREFTVGKAIFLFVDGLSGKFDKWFRTWGGVIRG